MSEKKLNEGTPTMEELRQRVALLECKVLRNCPYPDMAEALERDHEIAERVRAEKKWLQDEAARNEWGLEYAEKLSEKINITNRLLGVSKEEKP